MKSKEQILSFISGGKKYMDYNNNSEWETLTNNQRNGILEAINEIDAGKGISHELVIDKFLKKYSIAEGDKDDGLKII
jgi:hypothetical protein